MCKLFFCCLFILISVKPVHAVSVSILNYPQSIGEDKFNVTVKTEGASAGLNYLRVELYVDGSTNYFGETDNGQSWNSSSDGKLYFPISILSNTPNIATVSARIGTPSLTDYPGPGSYKLRVRRYTSSGAQGSEDPQPQVVTLTKSWPSPSPSSSPTSSPSLSPSPTSTPIPSPPPTPTQKPSIKPSPSPSPELTPPPIGTVAGAITEINLSGFGVSPSPKPSAQGTSSKAPKLNQARVKTTLYIGSGLILISIAGFFGYRKYLASHAIDDLTV